MPVHPRVGGEHRRWEVEHIGHLGSSPRGRGTHNSRRMLRYNNRFIPAWAGNTATRFRGWHRPPVHPRVGGEHQISLMQTPNRDGSSPRGRGTRGLSERYLTHLRFIPAWAGNTRETTMTDILLAVHPRVGGEHCSSVRVDSHISGSSPRGRGTHRTRREALPDQRFIPAWAGNTRRPVYFSSDNAVHPRVGGEHGPLAPSHAYPAGSSPRGRGTHKWIPPTNDHPRFIPAWAGNTRRRRHRSARDRVHPRVGGEHMNFPTFFRHPTGSSPRGRGTRRSFARQRRASRFIPAWAGNTYNPPRLQLSHSVHPRVGGEHVFPAMKYGYFLTGSSPRGRGTQLRGDSSAYRPAVHPRVGGEHQDGGEGR